MEQFDDILRTSVNERNKFQHRFGIRGTTLLYRELLVALENIITDRVATVPTARNRKIDASAPTDIGMAATHDGECLTEEGDQRSVDLALQAVYTGTGKEKWSFGTGRNWNEKYAEVAKMEERTHGRNAVARKEAKGKRKNGKGETRACWI